MFIQWPVPVSLNPPSLHWSELSDCDCDLAIGYHDRRGTHKLNYREAWGTVIPRGPPHQKVALLLASCNID